MGYQVFVKRAESRSTVMEGPFDFATEPERKAFVAHFPGVYWYHYAEEDDWHSWSRGGAWAATAKPGPADREHKPPEITDDDRWLHKIWADESRENRMPKPPTIPPGPPPPLGPKDCAPCGGSGSRIGPKGVYACPDCHGTGKV
jgi:hypothetical protein